MAPNAARALDAELAAAALHEEPAAPRADAPAAAPEGRKEGARRTAGEGTESRRDRALRLEKKALSMMGRALKHKPNPPSLCHPMR